MTKKLPTTKKEIKYRLTAFVDPIVAKRAKIRGALENLTLSEVVEKALDLYAPQFELNTDQLIKMKFAQKPSIGFVTSAEDLRSKRKAPKHTKNLVVPR